MSAKNALFGRARRPFLVAFGLVFALIPVGMLPFGSAEAGLVVTDPKVKKTPPTPTEAPVSAPRSVERTPDPVESDDLGATVPDQPVRQPVVTVPAAPTPRPTHAPLQTEVVGEADEGGAPQGDASALPRVSEQAPNSSSTDTAAARTSGEPNPAFPYTHLLPSPNTLPQGGLVVGANLAYGVTDFLQIGTDVIRDMWRVWNAQIKVPLIEYPTFIATAYLGWQNFNLRHIDERNPDLRINSWQPGLTTGFEIAPRAAWFIGGQFNATDKDVPDVYSNGFVHGARAESDVTWMYNPAGSKLSDNALSGGLTYDFTYDLIGIGVTHHWSMFSLGAHYVPAADHGKFLPLISVYSGVRF